MKKTKSREVQMTHPFKKQLFFLLVLVLLITGAVHTQEKSPEPAKFELTIDNIMKGEELIGTAPSNIMWSVDGSRLYFRWTKPGEERSEFYAITPSNLTPQKIEAEDLLKLPPLPSRAAFSRYSRYIFGMEINFDKENKRAVVVRNGDISLLDVATGKITQLTFTDERESNAKFTDDGEKIAFTCQDNLFLLSLRDNTLRQMTSISKKAPPPKKKPDEVEEWYRQQQQELFEEFSRPRRGRGMGMFPSFEDGSRRQPFFLEEDQSIFGLDLSPDEKYVTFLLSGSLPEVKQTIVPDYVTRTGYTETIDSHPKAAQSSQDIKTGIMDVSTGKVQWVDYGQGERKIYSYQVFWSPDGKKCALTASSRDRKDTWLLSLDPESGKTSAIEHVHDDAWVGEYSLTNVAWCPDSQHLFYISEKDGYAHLYKTAYDGAKKTQLTKGKFEVSSAQLSRDGKRWYLISNEEHPGETHFYSMPVEGGKRTRITTLKGQNEIILSPDESSLAVIHSSSNKPPELYFQQNTPKAKARQITLSTSEEFCSYDWYDPEIITFKARDGVDVYARLYRPKQWHPQRPAVIFIHGAGYLQNAHRGWSYYYREYMFHNILIESGYLVLDVDYRGSKGYGRDCRTAIYRHMGGKDLDDIVDAARFLAKEYKVNPERIGTYGGSYGGFLTLMAMFKAPDVFKAGAALRPVTDWAHYHSGYTVDILNLPHKDREAYEQSSPIYFAQGLKGTLLICHGMVDTNVHFQDTVRLAQRLIELGKENWEVAIYPVEGHSFHNSSSWADEYKRIFKLFEENLK
ncbi:MAG: S9 family peptidase [Candidatus Aminicenantes bacterium]|nr:S9 family peptidase [Candidatus Aminicenantes bacterium]